MGTILDKRGSGGDLLPARAPMGRLRGGEPNVIVRRSVTSVMAVLALATSVMGCGGKDEDDGAASSPPPATVAPTPAPTPTPAQTTQVVPEGQTAAGGPRVKAELEGRADGTPGSPFAVQGAKAALQVPTTWQSTPPANGISQSKMADGKTNIAAGNLTGDPMARVNELATAAGLTGCTWMPPEQLTAVGKDKIPGTAADGTCMRGTVKTAAAFVALPTDSLVVLGAWDEPGGDANAVFGSMRTIARAGQGDASGIRACCNALAQNAKSAPPHQQGAYIAAAAACNSLAANPQGRQGLATVRAMLAGAGVPASCK